MAQDKTMRITGGTLVRRLFKVPKLADENVVRPTPDRVREAIFSSLGDFFGLTILDLFAGSGSHGFEAISRGASQVVFVEVDPRIKKVIEENIALLELGEKCQIILSDALAWVFRPSTIKADIIFVDPPYKIEPDRAFFLALKDFLKPGGRIVFRCFPKKIPDLPEDFVVQRDRSYGGTRVFVIGRA